MANYKTYDVSDPLRKESLNLLGQVSSTGSIKKGCNEVTKAVERGTAMLVYIAEDVNPPEINMHIQPLCKEKEISFVVVPSKEELGAAAGIGVPTVSVAVTEEGEAAKLIKEITGKTKK